MYFRVFSGFLDLSDLEDVCPQLLKSFTLGLISASCSSSWSFSSGFFVKWFQSFKEIITNAARAWTDDGTEVTPTNRPRDRLFEWFFEPLVNLKDQLRLANLQESEERFLEKIILMGGDTERMGSWQNGGVEPEDAMRKGELLAIARR